MTRKQSCGMAFLCIGLCLSLLGALGSFILAHVIGQPVLTIRFVLASFFVGALSIGLAAFSFALSSWED